MCVNKRSTILLLNTKFQVGHAYINGCLHLPETPVQLAKLMSRTNTLLQFMLQTAKMRKKRHFRQTSRQDHNGLVPTTTVDSEPNNILCHSILVLILVLESAHHRTVFLNRHSTFIEKTTSTRELIKERHRRLIDLYSTISLSHLFNGALFSL